jgi:hypothetical protein
LVGACFALYSDPGEGVPSPDNLLQTVCDALDGADGITTFADVAPGSYIVVETFPPAGYGLAPPVRVPYVAGSLAVTVDVVNLPLVSPTPTE